MIEVEIQKLTAAITALVEVLRSAKVGNELPTETPTISDNLRQEQLHAERERRQAELDQQMADVYKAEQAKTKRKAKVTPEETKALVEAVVEPAPFVLIRADQLPPVDNENFDEEEKAMGFDKPHLVSDLTENDLKGLAMEIARADSSARNIILSILGEHGSKTITQLDPKHYRAVHARFLSLAHDIAKDGEEV